MKSIYQYVKTKILQFFDFCIQDPYKGETEQEWSDRQW